MSDQPSAPPTKRKIPRKFLIGGGVLVLAAVAAYFTLHYGRETTDDAFIEGHVMQVSPQVAGTVQRVLVDDNQEVKTGDLLVELDPRDNKAVYDQATANLAFAQAKLAQSQAQLSSAKAALAQAQADVEETRATADNAAKEQARNQELRERGVVSQQDVDRTDATAISSKAALDSKLKRVIATEADVKVNDAQVKSAEAQVELANALLDTARLRLSYTKITAPEDGRVTRKNVEVGNYVQTGAALMAIVPDDVWVVANFKETQLNHMRPGQVVDIQVDAYPSHSFRGTVDSIQAGTGARFSLLPAENATGNYVKVVQRVPVKIRFNQLAADGLILAPGMSVTPSVDIR